MNVKESKSNEQFFHVNINFRNHLLYSLTNNAYKNFFVRNHYSNDEASRITDTSKMTYFFLEWKMRKCYAKNVFSNSSNGFSFLDNLFTYETLKRKWRPGYIANMCFERNISDIIGLLLVVFSSSLQSNKCHKTLKKNLINLLQSRRLNGNYQANVVGIAANCEKNFQSKKKKITKFYYIG